MKTTKSPCEKLIVMRSWFALFRKLTSPFKVRSAFIKGYSTPVIFILSTRVNGIKDIILSFTLSIVNGGLTKKNRQ